MNTKKLMASCLAAALSLLTLPACGKAETPQMVNRQQFPLANIMSLTISYDEENISFYASDDSTLTVKEYMTVNNPDYYAKVKADRNSIKISEGNKPLARGSFIRYVEVYLPPNYPGSLTVTSTNGDINLSNMDFKLSRLRIDNTSGSITVDNATASEVHLSSTSGTVTAGHIRAKTIRLETTGGTISCSELDGNVAYTSTSGGLDVKSAIGSGSYRANNSGGLNVVYREVTGDLSFFNKNGGINLTLPQDLQFSFEAKTKNGTVTTNFQESLIINGSTARGILGTSPTVSVKVETNNGNINVIIP